MITIGIKEYNRKRANAFMSGSQLFDFKAVIYDNGSQNDWGHRYQVAYETKELRIFGDKTDKPGDAMAFLELTIEDLYRQREHLHLLPKRLKHKES